MDIEQKETWDFDILEMIQIIQKTVKENKKMNRNSPKADTEPISETRPRGLKV
jgi:hypothetical protein